MMVMATFLIMAATLTAALMMQMVACMIVCAIVLLALSAHAEIKRAHGR